jgi:hypothetical protein
MSRQLELFPAAKQPSPPTTALNLENPFHQQYRIPAQLGVEPNLEDPDLLSEKERVVVEGVLDGLSQNNAGLMAGYDNGGASVIQRPRVQSALSRALADDGLDERKISKRIRQGLKAKKSILIADDSLDVPDYGMRHKYLTTLLELRGDLDSKKDKEEQSWESMLFEVRARRLSP